VLALQGAFAAHAEVLEGLGAEVSEVRVPGDLARLSGLVMPGGESTTMSKLLVSSGLFAALGKRLSQGFPVFGTCAGMILLAARVLDGRPDQQSFSALDVTVRRNAYGRQVDSFEADLSVTGLNAPFPAVFIRAPLITELGDGVQVLARHEAQPVLVRQGSVMAASFHPELTGDGRLHELFLSEI
jgi:5'-phosphate synthase pdxT subunit